jgi:hypothetical protein
MQKTSVFSDFYCLPNKLALMALRPELSTAVPTGLSWMDLSRRVLSLGSLRCVLQDFEFGRREDAVVLDVGFVETRQHEVFKLGQ